MKKKSKQSENLRITLLCHQENINRCKKLIDDKAFVFSLIKLSGHKGNPNSVELKIGVVSDSNINDK